MTEKVRTFFWPLLESNFLHICLCFTANNVDILKGHEEWCYGLIKVTKRVLWPN